MKIDEILEKAFTTGDLAAGGLLNPEQAAKFVQGVMDKSVLIAECRREPMKATKRQIDKITYAGDILQKPEPVGTEHTNTTKPTASKIVLDAKEAIVAIDLAYEALEDSIEGQGLMDTIMSMTSARVGFEMDKLCLFGDSQGSTGTVLDILDGVLKQADQNVYDAASNVLTDAQLFGAYKLLPGKYADSETALRFYVSHLARLDYVNALAGKGVNDAFTKYLIEAKEPAYQGIAVRKLPALVTENIGGGSPAVNGSRGLLINPKNIVFGVHRDISYEMEKKPRKRIIEITMTLKIDFKLEEAGAVVKLNNIKHS